MFFYSFRILALKKNCENCFIVKKLARTNHLPKPSLPQNSRSDQKLVGIGNKRPMASLDANENAPIPKRVCKPAQNLPKPAEPVAKIDQENFFRSISLKPNGLFDLPDLNEHFDKQLDEVSAKNIPR